MEKALSSGLLAKERSGNTGARVRISRSFAIAAACALATIAIPQAMAAEFNAVDDRVYAKAGENKRINVLENDSVPESYVKKLVIASPPSHGVAWVNRNKKVRYLADESHAGPDQLVYRIYDVNGRTSEAKVSIQVTGLAAWNPPIEVPDAGNRIILTWNPGGREVNEYGVYFGTTADGAVLQVANPKVADGTLDPNSPYVELHSKDDLGVSSGGKVCFKIRAFAGKLSSALSDAVCADV